MNSSDGSFRVVSSFKDLSCEEVSLGSNVNSTWAKHYSESSNGWLLPKEILKWGDGISIEL